MKKDDLTQVKYVGTLRMKMLYAAGVNTIKQLSEMSLEKLAQVKTIGANYAKLIKAAAAESIKEKPQKPATKVAKASKTPKPTKAAPAKKKKVEDPTQNLRKQIKLLNRHLKQVNENLKPLDKKKYLELYIVFKKRSKTLKAQLNGLNKNPGMLSKKAAKKIIKNADALSAILKNVGKKPNKKKYQKVSQEIQSFSKKLKKSSYK